ncbi:MAG: hypothetical protein Ct9H90mP13_05810 [Pseudomonadota bacterium]|nr:MAG: hypothetical protein Ct9H90mP13_05810 [Pseudomonadota bacterium]
MTIDDAAHFLRMCRAFIINYKLIGCWLGNKNGSKCVTLSGGEAQRIKLSKELQKGLIKIPLSSG